MISLRLYKEMPHLYYMLYVAIGAIVLHTVFFFARNRNKRYIVGLLIAGYVFGAGILDFLDGLRGYCVVAMALVMSLSCCFMWKKRKDDSDRITKFELLAIFLVCILAFLEYYYEEGWHFILISVALIGALIDLSNQYHLRNFNEEGGVALKKYRIASILVYVLAFGIAFIFVKVYGLIFL